jgi:hypothetical protein
MTIDIIGESSPALNEMIHERLFAALGQHENWVETVRVKLQDLNGPRHGHDDKMCRLDITLRGKMQVMIEQRGDDPYVIVNEAAERAKQAVGRKVEKKRDER